MTDVAERLRLARQRAGYGSARDAALSKGLAVSTYIAHENGTRGVKHEVAERYARLFGVPGDEVSQIVPELIALCQGKEWNRDLSEAPRDRVIQVLIPEYAALDNTFRRWLMVYVQWSDAPRGWRVSLPAALNARPAVIPERMIFAWEDALMTPHGPPEEMTPLVSEKNAAKLLEMPRRPER